MRVNIVLVGPSGAGKDTIGRELARELGLRKTVSWTTRLPRRGEEDYRFVSEQTFLSKLRQGCFFEWSWNHGAYYGTPTLSAWRKYLLVLDPPSGFAAKERLNSMPLCPRTLVYFVDAADAVLHRRIMMRDGSEARMSSLEWYRSFCRDPRLDGVFMNNGDETVERIVSRMVRRTARVLNGSRCAG